MMAIWTQGSADELVAMSRAGFEKSPGVRRFLGADAIAPVILTLDDAERLCNRRSRTALAAMVGEPGRRLH